jgi:glucose-1-phosphate adenylyltransferase
MPKPKVLALVMAGGEGNRLELLTERRAKPALPFAGVYRLIDYGEVLARHRQRGAGVTVVTSEVPEAEASRQAVVEVAGDGRLSGFHYKPEEPPTTRVATEVFAFATGRLLDTLDELAAGDGELKDFGHDLLPRLVSAGEAFEHRMAGYWRDVGTVPAYWQAHMDLLDPARPLGLDDPAWPVLGRASQRLPARVEGSARLEGALLSPGSVVAGEVVRSVLGPGVVVEPGASVRDAVVLDDCVIAAGARVVRAVLDRGVRVGPDARVGGAGDDGPALVGEQARVPGGATVGPGGRFGHDGPEEAAD